MFSPPLAPHCFDLWFFGAHCIGSLVEIAEELIVGDMDGLIDGNLVKGLIDGELEKYNVGVEEVGTEGLSVVIVDGATVEKVLGSLLDGADDGESDDSKDGSFDSSTDRKDDGLKDGCEEGSIEAFIEGVLDGFKEWSADGFIDGLDNGSMIGVGSCDLNLSNDGCVE